MFSIIVAIILMMRASVSALPHWLTITESADATGVSTWTIRREIREGRLPLGRRVGRIVRVLDDDLADWMRGSTTPEAS